MKSVIALALVGSAAAFAPQAQGPVSIYILLCTLFLTLIKMNEELMLSNLNSCCALITMNKLKRVANML